MRDQEEANTVMLTERSKRLSASVLPYLEKGKYKRSVSSDQFLVYLISNLNVN